MLGMLAYRQFGHRPAGSHQSTSAWPLVIILAILGITAVAMVLVMRRQYRRPGYRRVMQYGWRQRARVGKDLRRGRVLSAEDMKVATALMELERSQRRWRWFYVLIPVGPLLNGLSGHGLSRWFNFGLVAFFLVLMPIVLRQQRQMTRGYERQNTHAVIDHQDDADTDG
jgi:preprotein translocase subunit YajC